MNEFSRLFDEEWDLFDQQMRNWDNLQAKAVKIERVCFILTFVALTVTLLVHWTQPMALLISAAVACLGIQITGTIVFWVLDQKHQKIDRQLESQKKEAQRKLDQLIAESKASRPSAAVAVRIKFRHSKKRQKRSDTRRYSPWDNFLSRYYS